MTNQNDYIYLTAVSLTAKLCKTLNYLNVLLPIKVNGALITRSGEIKSPPKIITILLPLYKKKSFPLRTFSVNVTKSAGDL